MIKNLCDNHLKPGLRNIIKRYEFGLFIMMIVLFAIFSVTSSSFLKVSNILTIVNQVSMIFVMGVGMTVVIILGGIDLSVGYVAGLTGMIITGLMSSGVSLGAALLAGMAAGMLIGFINGVIIAKLSIADFIVTLATMLIAHGFIFVFSNGKSIYQNIPQTFKWIGIGNIGGIPVLIFIAAIIFVIGSLLLNKFRLGTYIYATGGNREAARLSGINTNKVRIIGYTFSGLMAGVAGIMMAARLGSGQPTAGDSFLFDAVGAVVLGGTSLAGGEGSIFGTLIGVIIIGAITNGLTQLGMDSYWQEVIKGVIIILAVTFNAIRAREKKGK